MAKFTIIPLTEMAYRLPGETWKRKTFKTAEKLGDFAEFVADEGGESATRRLV